MTELLRDTSIRNVNTVLTLCYSFFLYGEKERRELKMNYKAMMLEAITAIIPSLHRF